MTSDKTKTIKKLWIGLAEYYRMNLTDNQLTMYAEDLEDLEISEVAQAFKRIRREELFEFLPLPAKIRSMILGSTKDLALDASNLIVEAMSRFGYTNPESARAFIGELGWKVVQREGGWQSLCERTTNDDLPILKAQWRELAGALYRRDQTGRGHEPPGLPSSKPMEQVSVMGNKLLKELPK